MKASKALLNRVLDLVARGETVTAEQIQTAVEVIEAAQAEVKGLAKKGKSEEAAG